MEEITTIKKKAKTILNDKFSEFINEGIDHLPSIIDSSRYELPGFLKHFTYPVSTWPIIIDTKIKSRLDLLITRLPELQYEIPKAYFKNNVEDIANFYFKGDKTLTEFALMCHQKKNDVSYRLDLVLSDDGFKLLEINAGSSVGGWQLDDFEPIVKDLHKPLNSEKEKFKYKRTQSTYIKFLIDTILKSVDGVKEEVNILLTPSSFDDEETKHMRKCFFDILYQKELANREMKGEVFVDGISSLTLIDGDLYLNQNKRIHGVLMMNFGEEELNQALFRALITDKVYLPDHMGTILLRDKRNLAILRELALNNTFQADDNNLILESIPWTVLMKEGTVEYKNETRHLLDLLKSSKDNFVIKISDGLRGDNVYIGKFIAENEWENIIKKSVKHGGYIVQEYCESQDFLAPKQSNEWTPNKLIWGAFGFGQTYGGLIVRMTDAEKATGAINSATGAVLAIVYESVN